MQDRIDTLFKELKILGDFKFLVHKHKGDWSWKDIYDLLEGLKGEIAELEKEIEEGNKEKALSELGDCVNYLIMLTEKIQNEV